MSRKISRKGEKKSLQKFQQNDAKYQFFQFYLLIHFSIKLEKLTFGGISLEILCKFFYLPFSMTERRLGKQILESGELFSDCAIFGGAARICKSLCNFAHGFVVLPRMFPSKIEIML